MKAFRIIAFVSMLAYMGLGFATKRIRASDPYIRSLVVKISNPSTGQCTATSVHAKSGQIYLLSAAHCRGMLVKGQAIAEREDGSKFIASIIRYDTEHDLMLMTSEDKMGLSIGADVNAHDHIHSLTHGGGHTTYRSDGEWLEEKDEVLALSVITSEKDVKDCSKEKNQFVSPGMFGMLCMVKNHVGYSTMAIIPGSSGGAVLNDSGEVIGVVSGYNPEQNMSLLIHTRFIRALLANY